MNLTIKNEKLREFFREQHEYGERMWKESQTNKMAGGFSPELKSWIVHHPESAMYGALETLVDLADSNNITLDLTYDSLHNLSRSLNALFLFQQAHGYPDDKNIPATAKALAAYLTFLAMNEKNWWFTTKTYNNNSGISFPLWSDRYEFLTGKRENVDLLPAAMEAFTPGTAITEGGVTFHADVISPEFLKLTKLDLEDHGLQDFYVNG